MKKFTEGSYCDVRGWDEELIKKAAEMMAEDLGKEIWEYGRSLVVTDLAHYLYLPTPEFEVGVYGPSALGYFGTMNNVTKEEVEQMIKEREEEVIPLEKTEHGIGVGSCADSTITLLSQAAERLIQVEKDYQEAIANAQQEYAGKFEIQPLLKLVHINSH